MRVEANQEGFLPVRRTTGDGGLRCTRWPRLALAVLVLSSLSGVRAQAQQQEIVHFSTFGNGTVPGVATPYDDSDIYSFAAGAYSRARSGVADFRLPAGANIDALSWDGSSTLYLSFANTSLTIPGLGTVLDEQVVRHQDGTWSLFFNGATCGLNVNADGDVDAIAIVGNVLYFSTLGNATVSGLTAPDDADVYSWTPGTASCSRVLDGSAVGLPTNADIDALEIRNSVYYLSFDRDTGTTVPGGIGVVQDEVAVSYDPATRTWARYFDGTGLNATASQDVDAIAIEVRTPPPPAPVLSISAPAGGSTVVGPTIDVSFSSAGNLAEASLAKFRLDGGPDMTIPSLQGQFQVTDVLPGPHVLDGYLARADNTRITGSDAAPVSFSVTAPSVAPRLQITAPAANATLTNSTVSVSFTSIGDLTEANHAHFQLDGGADMMIMSLEGQFQIDGVTAGNHLLDGFLVRSDHSKITGSDAATVPFAVDTTPQPPRLTITSPVSGAALTGSTVDISFASAGDLSQADHVHLQLDGGPDIMVMSLNGQLQLTEVAAGPHFVDGYLVRADHSKIAGSDAARVSFSLSVPNPNDPVLVGQWSSQVIDLPTVAVNLALLKSGKAIFWAGDFATAPNYGEVWDPTTNLITPAPNPYSNIFCSANVALPDGRLLVAGGHDGQILGMDKATTFDPVTETWAPLPSMAYRRWYPTLTALADGRAIIMSGSENSESVFVEIPEIYDPVANTWTQLGNARLSVPQYPMMYLLPSGKLLQSGSTETPTATRVLDIPSQTWSVLDSRVLEGGSGVMYRPGLIMKSGSASNDGVTPTAVSAATTYVLDTTVASPAWRATTSMQFPRTFHNLTSLADGTVLVTSGSQRKSETNLSAAVLPAELWSPDTETWTTMAPMRTPRIYHSTAVLLPDGRVAVSGSGNIAGATDQKNLEIFSPPYLFKGSRPVLTSAPSRIEYGTTFTIQTPNAQDIKAVNLLRPGAATHNFDQDQRFVPLSFSKGSGALQVQASTNPNVVPPGYYMLFLINNAGVPSVAQFVRFPAPYEDSIPPTAPGTVTVTGSMGTASLAWLPATDNGGIAAYEVHRSTVPGFTPAASTRVARVTATNYTDEGLAAGTYYYQILAVDQAGNVGPATASGSVTVTADTVLPSVSIATPADGATVAGIVTVTANASDNLGVAGVQFRLDGVALGPEDTVAPYSYAWNTSTVANGTHVLTAVARDAAGNTSTSIAVSLILANTVQQPTGLVAAYGFEEGTGTTVADASGSGNNGTVSGALWSSSGRYGNALAFDGVNDIVTVPDANSLDLTTGLTLEAWVYPTALSGWRTVLLKEVSSELAYALYAHDDVPRPAGYVRVGSSQSVAGSTALPLNTWTHLALTYDGTTLRLYQGGTQIGSRAVTGTIATSSLPLRIGGNAIWGEYFAGRIDEVTVYNRALSASEIQADMAGPLPTAPRLNITAPASGATISGTTVNVDLLHLR